LSKQISLAKEARRLRKVRGARLLPIQAEVGRIHRLAEMALHEHAAMQAMGSGAAG